MAQRTTFMGRRCIDHCLLEFLEPRAYLAADIIPTIKSVKIPDLIVPGDTGTLSVNIANQGNTAATGTVKIEAFASTDQTISGDDLPLTVSGFDSVSVKLAAGKNKTFSGKFTVPQNVVPTNYFLVIRLSALSGFAGHFVSTTDVATTQSVQAGLLFGAVGSRNNVKLLRDLGEGDIVTFALSGPGTGQLVDAGGGNLSLMISNTTIASNVKITGKGGSGHVFLTGITDNESLGTLNAPVINLTGNLNITGESKKITLNNMQAGTISVGNTAALSLTLDDLKDASITTGPISSLSVNSWTSTGSNMTTTPYISTLKCNGDFNAALNLSGTGAPSGVALKTVTIQDNLNITTWKVGGAIGTVHVFGNVFAGVNISATGALTSFTTEGNFSGDLAAASITTFKVFGNITESHILAGASFGANGALGGNDDTFAAGTIKTISVDGGIFFGALIAGGLNAGADDAVLTNDDSLIPGGKISSITVAGDVDADCNLLAASLPAKAKIAGVQTATNGDMRFTL